MELVTLPDDRLFSVSTEVERITDDLRQKARDMVDTMHRANGVGLAGVQVGIMQRLFVVHVDGDVPRVFINPRLTLKADRLSVYEEGCLSIPGIYADVERPEAVRVEALDVEGNPFELEADGFLARVIQHEYDHLEGRLFYQHLSESKQRRFLRSYEKLHHVTL